jgi:putative oxidoreductase
MFRSLFHTSEDTTLSLLRASLGVVFLAHGAQKMLGWFGGPGFAGTMGSFTHGLGIPAFLAVLVILAEFLGGIGLILGFLGRIAAFGIAVDMLVALFLVHLPNGFFMNWTGTKGKEGFEFHILAISMAVVLMVRGAGAWSLDRVVDRRIANGRRIHPGFHPQPMHG